MRRSAEVRRTARACRWVVLWAAVVLSLTGEISAGPIAFTYYGENTRSPGDTAGGYFFLDPDRLPSVRFDPFWRATIGTWDLSGLEAVNYQSLAKPTPVRASGNEVWAIKIPPSSSHSANPLSRKTSAFPIPMVFDSHVRPSPVSL